MKRIGNSLKVAVGLALLGVLVLGLVAAFQMIIGAAQPFSASLPSAPAPTQRLSTATPGKFDPALYERLQTMEPEDEIVVMIWVAGTSRRSEVELFAALAAKYPEAKAALERTGKPFDVGDYNLTNEIEAEYVRMLEEDTRALTQALIEYLQTRGYTAQTFSAMPAIAATLPKALILEVAERDDVGAIGFLEDTGNTPSPCVAQAKAGEEEMPFDTIETTEWGGTLDYYDLPDPKFVIIARAEDIAMLDNMVSPKTQAQLEAIDFNENFVVAVFQGWKPDRGGYGVDIPLIARNGNRIVVYACFQEPRPGYGRQLVVSSPYHVVRVTKSGNFGGEFEFVLNVAGTVIAAVVTAHDFLESRVLYKTCCPNRR